MPRRCPCGTGLPYAECCRPLHDGTGTAASAEQLMRSRYSAFAVGDPAYLLATWHPTTRPTGDAATMAARRCTERSTGFTIGPREPTGRYNGGRPIR
jgi:uncharacterized protein YchJ